MEKLLLCAAIAVLAVAAYGDVRRRRIANGLSIAVAVLAVLRLALIGDPGAALRTVLAALVVFAVSFVLFWRGVLGGGDAKLVTAATLLVGSRSTLDFLFFTSLVGGLLVPLVLAADKFAPRLRPVLGFTVDAPAAEGAPAGASRTRPTVPYGVAIATACTVVLILQSTSMW